MCASKEKLREQIKILFKTREKDFFKEEDRYLLHTICEHPKIKKCQKIALYISEKDEVDTKKMITTLFSLWKTLFIPFIEGKNIYFSEIKKDSLLVSWIYGVKEPKEKIISDENIEVFLVPWRAFSSKWKRLWRGKWYYDRFFSWEKYKNSYKIGVAYSFQILSTLPFDEWDILMDEVIYFKK